MTDKFLPVESSVMTVLGKAETCFEHDEAPDYLDAGACCCPTRRWPEPTTEEPSIEQFEEWVFDAIVEATDGCSVEPDGVCPHGHPSWMLKKGMI